MNYDPRTFRGDFFGDVTSMVVALPTVASSTKLVAGKERTECVVMGLSGSVEKTLGTLDILRDVPEDRVVETLDEARQTARALLDD